TAPHQTKAASSVMALDFMPGTTSPVGSTMLAVASPSSKSLAVVWRNDLVTAAVAVAAAAVDSSVTDRIRSRRTGRPGIVNDARRFRPPPVPNQEGASGFRPRA